MSSSRRALFVHAHPDDETINNGATMARYVAEGAHVTLLTCTLGEEGEVLVPELAHLAADRDDGLGRHRIGELATAMEALRVEDFRFLGGPGRWRDSGMMGTPANERPDCFWQADLAEAVRDLVAVVREVRPQVVVTYDSNGGYGHPDHIQAHRIAVAAFDAAADASCFPEAGPPHEVAKLYEMAFNREEWFALMMELRNRGISLPWGMDERFGDAPTEPVVSEPTVATELPPEELNPTNLEALRAVSWELGSGVVPDDFGTADAEITTRVDVRGQLDAKREAMACHRTQQQDLGWMLELPEDLVERAMGTEFFVLRRWRGREPLPSPPELRETDLFDGLA